jgi:acyl-CoA thioesterase-1
MYPAVARANGVALYPFFLDGVAAQPALQLADGMHPNPKGVAVIVKRILPAVERELDAKR